MSNNNIFAIIIVLVSGVFLYTFTLPFKAFAVDPVVEQSAGLKTALEQATQQLSLKTLRAKKQQLSDGEISFLKNFVPENLHSGLFVYNLGQIANQKKLSVKGIQYSIIEDLSNDNKVKDKKLLVDLTLSGRYEDFELWLSTIEKSDVLIEVESFHGSKESNSSEIITFLVKLYAYGINID
jgi:Tfp pilus assembly protein PilO